MNIALTGAMRSGKNTVSAYLRDNYGYTEFAFGDELKRLAHEVFDVPRNPKPRELYQTFGQWCRQRDPDVWVRKCFEEIAEESGISRLIREWRADCPMFRAVITDLRQPNELERCRTEGYVIIRVKAASGLRIQRAVESADTFNLADLTHETESHVDGFAVDYEITNDGTLAELYRQVDVVMSQIDAIMADIQR